jgi:hypothetical protein
VRQQDGRTVARQPVGERVGSDEPARPWDILDDDIGAAGDVLRDVLGDQPSIEAEAAAFLAADDDRHPGFFVELFQRLSPRRTGGKSADQREEEECRA